MTEASNQDFANVSSFSERLVRGCDYVRTVEKPVRLHSKSAFGTYRRTRTSTAVIAGHKRQGRADNPTIIEETRQYLRDFDRVVDATTTPQELYEQMLELYPDRLNPGVLWSSAQAMKSDASPLWGAVRSLDG